MASPHSTSDPSASLQLIFQPLGVTVYERYESNFTKGDLSCLWTCAIRSLTSSSLAAATGQPSHRLQPSSITEACHLGKLAGWACGESILAIADDIAQEVHVPTLHQTQTTSRMLRANAGLLPWTTKFCGEAGGMDTLILSCWPVGLVHCPTMAPPPHCLSAQDWTSSEDRK